MQGQNCPENRISGCSKSCFGSFFQVWGPVWLKYSHWSCSKSCFGSFFHVWVPLWLKYSHWKRLCLVRCNMYLQSQGSCSGLLHHERLHAMVKRSPISLCHTVQGRYRCPRPSASSPDAARVKSADLPGHQDTSWSREEQHLPGTDPQKCEVFYWSTEKTILDTEIDVQNWLYRWRVWHMGMIMKKKL